MTANRMIRRPVQCGEVWLASLDPITGHEQGGTRPVMIVSGSEFNDLPHGLCVVAPITSRIRNISTHVLVEAPEGGLRSPSMVMCDQLRTVSLNRLKRRWGVVEITTLLRVKAVIQRVFEI